MKKQLLTFLLLLLCSAMSMNAALITGSKTWEKEESFTYSSSSNNSESIMLASLMSASWSSGIPDVTPYDNWDHATNYTITQTSATDGITFTTSGTTYHDHVVFTCPRSTNKTYTWKGYVECEHGGNTYKEYMTVTFKPVYTTNNIKFATPAVTQELSGSSITYTQTATSSSTATKTYSIISSSTVGGATINSSTGQVTATKAGTYVIQCHQDAKWNQTSSYNSGNATYTLTVTDIPVISETYTYSTSDFKRWLKATEVLTENGASTSTYVLSQNVESITIDGTGKTISTSKYSSGTSNYNGTWSRLSMDFGITSSTIPTYMASTSANGVETYYASSWSYPTSASSYSWIGIDINHPATTPIDYAVQVYVSANQDGSNPYRVLYVSTPDPTKLNGVKMTDGSDWLKRGKCEFCVADLRTDGLAGTTAYSVVSATAVDGTTMVEGVDYTIDTATGIVVSKKAGTFTVKADFAGNSTTGYFPASATSTFTVKPVGDFWPVPEGFSKNTAYTENYIEACPLTFGNDTYSTVAGANDDIDYADIPANLRAFEYYTTGTTPPNGNATTIPTSGTFYRFTPINDNYLLTVGIKLDKRCKFWLLDYDTSAGTITSRTELGSGLETWNGVNGTVSLFTQSGHEYYFFSEQSPLSIYGYHYSDNPEGYYEKHGFLTRTKKNDE